MTGQNERRKSSSVDKRDDDDEELHQRKRALTHKIDRRILPLLS